MAHIVDMGGMGLISSVLAPLLVWLTAGSTLWNRVPRLPARTFACFVVLHAAVTIGMTRDLPMAVMALGRPVLLAGACLFWLPVLGPARLRLAGPRRCLYLFLAGPVLDLPALWLIAHGDDAGGLAMITAMLPLNAAALALTWQWVEGEERDACIAEGQERAASIAEGRGRAARIAEGQERAARIPDGEELAGQRTAPPGPAGAGHWLTRRRLRLGVACLWLSAAALQAQPFMFTAGFGREVLGAAAVGQPAPLAALVRTASDLVASQPVLANSAFVAIQAALGLSLLSGRLARPALIASIGWATAVWAVGEGFGSLLCGPGTLLAGVPGAALIYAVLGAAALPPRRHDGRGLPVPPWVARAWPAVWLLLVLAGPWPEHAAVSPWGDRVASSATALPPALARALAAVPLLAARHPLAAGIVMNVLMAFAGVAALRPGPARDAAVLTGSGLAALASALALPALLTGQATDVGTGPPLLLLAAAAWATRRSAPPEPARAPETPQVLLPARPRQTMSA
jgi:hypothetical protein